MPWAQLKLATPPPPPIDLFDAHEGLASLQAGLSALSGALSSLFCLAAVLFAARLALRYSCDLGERCTSWVAVITLFIYASTSTASVSILYTDQLSILISAAFSWLSLASLAASTRSGAPLHAILSPLCLAIALWNGLEGLCGGAFVLAYACWGDPRPLAQRIRNVAPHALMWILAASFALTRFEQGCGIMGLVGRFARLCAESLAWLPPTSAQCVDDRGLVLIVGLGALTLAGAVLPWILAHASPNHQRTLRWTSRGALLSLLPALLAPADGRYLLCTSLGASFFFASALRRCGQAMREKQVFALALGLGALRHFVLAPVYTFLFALFLAPKDTSQTRHEPEDPDAQSTSGAPAENAYLAVSATVRAREFGPGTGYADRHAESRSVRIAPCPHPRCRR